MSFRLADLKKTVRKARDGYQVTATRLEGRPPAFRIEFLLQQFEGHLGCPRRQLDPNALLDFVGDARLGRGLLATLSQWYRMRPRTFPELLEDGGARLREHGIAGPVDLRAWLYSAVNSGGKGYLDPEAEPLFWQAQARALGFRRDDLRKLMLLDQPEEAVLVRTGPSPTTADVMAAYNARAQTTLLRSACEVRIQCDAPASVMERAARAWADPLDVEWQVEVQTLKLFGRADALGCWTRHGRRVERAALELLALPDLAARELQGRLTIGDRDSTFLWKERDTLALLGTGRGSPLEIGLPDRIAALAAALRRERDRGGASAWGIRHATHLIGVEGAVFLPHLELRRGDLSLYLRVQGPGLGPGELEALAPFSEKTPIGFVEWSGTEHDPLTLHLAGRQPIRCGSDALLAALAPYLNASLPATQTTEGPRRPLKRAA